ncbi:hypothetical protein QBC38DRAFT_251841 [Podospora fimiseda]|uniref:Uncharacterized protein n=1 Tax=Podospora fimiseda TaxID=252190 RepID=A0AAN7H1J3_9PEZI|nr:hypothetical protein QBC38DRAFT_251841 [Podospora fimiseda]
MEFFRWQREAWHKQLIASGARFYLGNHQPSKQLDISILRQATDTYIRKRGLAPGSAECDQRLLELVSEHSRREQDGSRRVGFLACIHALSRQAALKLLVSMREESTKLSSHVRFLNSLVVSHLANPVYVPEREYRVAQALMQLLTTPNFLPVIMLLFENLDQDPDRYLLPPRYIKLILNTKKLCATLQGHMSQMYQDRKLMSLHNSLSWLRPLTGLQQDSTAIQVVSELLPDWRTWTTWKPNHRRLRRWEEGVFTELQRTKLRPIFDLEGPDTTGAGHGSLKESVPGCFKDIKVANDDPSVLSRVLHVLDSAQQVTGVSSVDLVIFLCIDNPSPLDPELLSLAEAILAIKDDIKIHAMLTWLQSHSDGFNSRLAALTRVIPVFDGHLALQHLLAAYISSDIIQVIPQARAEYDALLVEGVASHLGMRLYRAYKVILAASWLHPALPPELLRSIQHLPPEETLDEILDALEASQSFAPQINNYLRVAIGGHAGDADAMLPTIQRTIRFHRRDIRPDQASLAHAINNVQYLDDTVREACLQQLLVENDSFLRELLPIVRTESNMSCTDFATLLVRRYRLGCTTHQCWDQLLFCFLLYRQDEILNWSADALSARHFFQWAQDLKILFPDGDNTSSLADLGFTIPRYQWWQSLSSQYGNALASLEELFRGHGSLKWLWLEEVPEVTTMLGVLQQPYAASPQQRFVISYLQPSTYVVRLTCGTLAGLNRAAPSGQVAFESICAREQQSARGEWHRPATQALSYCWRLSPEISPADREVLRMLTLLLDLNDGVDVHGIYNARKCVLEDYRKLFVLAQELQGMQVRLRNHDVAMTVAFLDELGVEDIRPAPPTVVDSDIPIKLSSFIESIGDNHWELCFPLNEISALKRQIIGIDTASRLLLVRLQLSRQSPPKFCVHFHPPKNEGDESGPHSPHILAGVMPERSSCSTQPSTLFVYLLSRVLYTSISKSQNQLHSQVLSSTYSDVATTLSSPSSICPVYVHPHSTQFKVHRPTVCSKPQCTEIFARAPLEVRAHHLLSNPMVLELLLACVWETNQYVGPAEKHAVRDSFPSLSGTSSVQEVLSRIQGYDDLATARENLIGWMAETFTGCLMSAPTGSKIPAMHWAGQFVLRSNGREDYDEDSSDSSDSSDEDNSDDVWEVKFFVVPVGRLWQVLCDGKIGSFDRGGSREGMDEMPEQDDGVGSKFTWQRFEKKRVILACEVSGGGSVVRVRYVFVCKEGWIPPKMRVIGDALRQSIGAMRKGRLVKE